MKAIMYGAGNIGRGFIGALLSNIGYEVVFVDVNDDVVNQMNKDHSYPQEIVGENPKTNWIQNIRAIDGKDADLVSNEIATADLLATSVGVSVLEKIVPILSEGLVKRWDMNPDNSIDLLICENLMDADKILYRWIKEALPDKFKENMDQHLGLVETSIGRMVPIMTEEMKKGDPLRICVEEYDYLPVNKSAFTTSIPSYEKIVPYDPFKFYLERKLYIHNMGHCMTAFLGKLKGYTYIDEAICDLAIRKLVEGAMIESAMAISKKYQVPFDELKAHIDDLLRRFQNKYLGDTIERVGREPLRKLQPKDRLVGAARNCETQGILPLHLSLAIACGLFHETAKSPVSLLNEVCIIKESEDLGKNILSLFDLIQKNRKNIESFIPFIDIMYFDSRGFIC
ncbi:MAG: mannitol dehydrogenase [Anaerostipes sp.]|jgi:mannitol-1-phosphate 5-dehydrogenase|nr:mannitol dehydrogenase [Anaerostipes sp.]